MRQSICGLGALCLTLIPLASFAAPAGELFSGLVIRVADGDTLTVLREGRSDVRVRLAEIDAPESGQAFGGASRRALTEMCLKLVPIAGACEG